MKITWLGTPAAGNRNRRRGALRDFARAMAAYFTGTHRKPSWRKAGRDEGFCVRDVNVRRLNRRWGAVRVPKVGELRLRLSRPLLATTGMARLTLDRAGRWHVAFTLPSRRSTANQLAALSGSTGAWPRPWRSHTTLPAR